MKPLNYDNSPCSPISSNCVIWQGPDLHCIKLCKGDTISDVIANLATELCNVMEQTNVSNYDLTCFDLVGCKPETFQALLQFLIDKICELYNLPSTVINDKDNEDLITVAPCFIVNGITVMTLIEYVIAIGLRICSILDAIANLQIQIDNLDIRVTILEGIVPPTFTLPSFIVDCTLSPSVLGGQSYTIDIILESLVNDDTYGYCQLLDSTGLPAELASAVASQCILSATPTLSNSPVPFGIEYLGSWIGTPTTVADAITNIWIVLCDYYDFLSAIDNVVVAAGEGISVTSATVSNVTTYTVTNDYLETFIAYLTINDSFIPLSGEIPFVFPSLVSGIIDGQTIMRYTQVSSDSQSVIAGVGTFVPNANLPPISFGSFDNTIGVFTITDPGTYLIKATAHLKPDNTSSVYWSGNATFSATPTVTQLESAFLAIGSFYIGITPDDTSNLYIADSQTLTPGIDKNIEISTSKVITTNVPIELKVKVLNTTNRNYDGKVYAFSDFINFSIVKLRNDLTVTQL